jgi:hypothetical protein
LQAESNRKHAISGVVELKKEGLPQDKPKTIYCNFILSEFWQGGK